MQRMIRHVDMMHTSSPWISVLIFISESVHEFFRFIIEQFASTCDSLSPPIFILHQLFETT